MFCKYRQWLEGGTGLARECHRLMAPAEKSQFHRFIHTPLFDWPIPLAQTRTLEGNWGSSEENIFQTLVLKFPSLFTKILQMAVFMGISRKVSTLLFNCPNKIRYS
jgi:hypothetical protein